MWRKNSLAGHQPPLESQLTRDKFLRVIQLEAGFQYLTIVEVLKSWQSSPDMSRNRIIPLAMPPQILLGLLLEVFEIRHKRYP